jgi:hypothetical protein
MIGGGIKYESDFSSDEDGWIASSGTATGNIDSIGGVDDWLRLAISVSAGVHRLNANPINAIPLIVGHFYNIKFDYYIPSGNSQVDGIGLYDLGSPNQRYGDIFSATDTVTSVELNFTASTLSLAFVAMDGILLNYAQSLSGDYIYIKNVIFTRLASVLDIGPENFGTIGTIDSSGNGLHGVVSGARALSPVLGAAIVRDVKLAIADTATELTNIVPKGYRITSIRGKGTDSLTDVKIGTSSGGEQVVASTTAGTTAALFTLAATAISAYSETAAVSLYAEHDTASETLDLIFTMEKVV